MSWPAVGAYSCTAHGDACFLANVIPYPCWWDSGSRLHWRTLPSDLCPWVGGIEMLASFTMQAALCFSVIDFLWGKHAPLFSFLANHCFACARGNSWSSPFLHCLTSGPSLGPFLGLSWALPSLRAVSIETKAPCFK